MFFPLTLGLVTAPSTKVSSTEQTTPETAWKAPVAWKQTSGAGQQLSWGI